MDNVSSENLANATRKVGSWVPQIYFDLIARIIPGGLAIALLYLSINGYNNSLLQLYTLLDENWGFPSILLIILLVVAVSYSYAICAWGLWYGIYGGLRKIFNEDIDQETFVLHKCKGKEFPDLYEDIKKHDVSAGNRLTKLKAEIHMSGTLIISCILSQLVLCIKLFSVHDPEIIYFIIILLLAIIGLSFALKHFVSRARKIVENKSVICNN